MDLEDQKFSLPWSEDTRRKILRDGHVGQDGVYALGQPRRRGTGGVGRGYRDSQPAVQLQFNFDWSDGFGVRRMTV